MKSREHPTMTKLRSPISSEQQSKLAALARTFTSHSQTTARSKHDKASCSDCRLLTSCLSKDLSSDELKQLSGIMKAVKPLRKSLHLYRQADQFKSLFIIKSGFAKSYVTDIDGNELAVSFFMPGEIIGLDGLYPQHYLSSVMALEDTLVCEIPYEAFESLCATQPLLQKHFNELQSRQIVQEREMTMLRGQKTAVRRLTAFLLNMSNRYKRQKLSPVSFRLPMSRGDIAGCLGLRLETVSRLFTTLQKQDLLVVNGRDVTLTNLKPGGVLSH
jgi:CRP/FNR family transcriptional regulator